MEATEQIQRKKPQARGLVGEGTMDKEQPRVKNPTGMLTMHGLVIAIVVYMFWQILKNYLAGGPDAPSLALVIGAGVVLLGGCVVIGYMAIRLYRQSKRQAEEDRQEKE